MSAGDRKRAVDQELKELREERKRARADLAALESEWRLDENERATVLALYMLADANLWPLLLYMRRLGIKHKWQDASDDELTLLITGLYTAASDEELTQLVDCSIAQNIDALREAYSYAHAWRISVRAYGKNQGGGVPRGSTILNHAEMERRKIPVIVRPHCWGSPRAPGSRKFLQRWKESYGGRIGSCYSCNECNFSCVA